MITAADNYKKAILILSGGMDSATLLYHLLDLKIHPICVSFNYGQRHKKELVCAEKLAEVNKLHWELIDLSQLRHLLKGSSQTDDSVPVPVGQYDAENMKLTVVPNRNMIMLSIAMGIAIANDITQVFYGAHAGDHTIYPDCRPEFIEKLNEVAYICYWKQVQVVAPFSLMTKGEICTQGIEMKVPYELTWTCYTESEKPCGICGSCNERISAFEFAHAKDPLEYLGGVAHG